MKVSMKVDYGVRALVELAQRYGGGTVQTVEIAESQGIPEAYLDQLLATLQKFGFIRSRRGPQGGHVLARAPHEISLGMVMASLEGTAAPLDCMEEPTECTLSSICAQRDMWRSVEDAVQSVLSSTTIADLANRQRQLQGQGVYQV
ncbi:MAG: Rrf2 family transcriptional regulator [Dehalococcoidia bacterium]|nr:Rrf2 family transcriptional regulator [Dehalococcoidia bacterium]